MSIDALDRLHQRLQEAVQRAYPDGVGRQLTIADVYQHLIPYRQVRGELGIVELQEYEHTLLRLLAGEHGHVELDVRQVAGDFEKELRSPNPILGIYRDYAGVGVTIQGAADRPADAGEPEFEAEFEAEAADRTAEQTWTWPEEGPGAEGETTLPAAPAQPARPPAPLPAPAIATAPPARSWSGASATGPHAGSARIPGPAVSSLRPAADSGGGAPAAGPYLEIPAAASAAGGDAAGGSRWEAPPTGAAPADGGTAEPPPPAASREDCWSCNEPLPAGRPVRFCPQCGLVQIEIPCEECSAPLEPDWKFCVSCGAPRSSLPLVRSG
jgi:hypothetical protein